MFSGGDERIEADHFHSQARGAFGDDAADVAEADDADGFVAYLDADEFVALPLAAFERSDRLGNMTRQGHHQAMVCSPVVTLLPPGVFITTMPRLVAASASIFS